MKKMKDGYSLVELLIAVAISTIVLMGLLAILGYGLRSMGRTQAKVALQDEAKDVMNHISSYAMESSTDFEWDGSSKRLLIVNKKYNVDDTEDTAARTVFAYWQTGDAIYFAGVNDPTDPSPDPDKILDVAPYPTPDPSNDYAKFLLAEDVTDFQCVLEEPTATSGKRALKVTLHMNNDIADYDCTKTVYLRTSR